MKFCTKCGKELFDEAVICPGCGCPAPSPQASCAPPFNAAQVNPTALLTKLSEKVKTNAIIWLVIGILQLLAGIALMSLDESFDTTFLMVVGALNIASGISDMNYSKKLLQNPTGIVKHFEALAGPIIVMIYNLVIGGLIGVIGSIYYLTAIRSFVMENKDTFLAIERTQGGNV